MNDNIFDKHYKDYNKVLADSLGLSSDEKCSFFDNYKANIIGKQFDVEQPYNILDFGCGIGKLSILLARMFVNSHVIGHDLSENTLKYAQECHADIPNLTFFDTVSDEQQFDIIVASNVFHHVKKNERKELLQSLFKKLMLNGALVVIEHNPFNPLTRYIVKRCPLDVDAELIKRQEFIDIAMQCGFEASLKKYILIFPWDLAVLRKIEALFEQTPLGAQYFLMLTRNS